MADANDIALDLDPLVDGDGEAGVERLLDEAAERGERFAERHEGKVAELSGEGLVEAMHELAAISELAGRAGSFAMLRFSTDTSDPPRARSWPRCRSAARRSRPGCCSSSWSGPRSTTSGPRSCSPTDGWPSAATTCARSAATGRTC